MVHNPNRCVVFPFVFVFEIDWEPCALVVNQGNDRKKVAQETGYPPDLKLILGSAYFRLEK